MKVIYYGIAELCEYSLRFSSLLAKKVPRIIFIFLLENKKQAHVLQVLATPIKEARSSHLPYTDSTLQLPVHRYHLVFD